MYAIDLFTSLISKNCMSFLLRKISVLVLFRVRRAAAGLPEQEVVLTPPATQVVSYVR